MGVSGRHNPIAHANRRIPSHMKKCPFCAEEIQDEAIKCKHCFEFLDGSGRSTPPALPVFYPPSAMPVPPAPQGDSLPWYFRTSFIVLMFLSLPPLALPSVWWHPKWHILVKIGFTAAVAASCWGVVVVFLRLLEYANEMSKMLDGGMKL